MHCVAQSPRAFASFTSRHTCRAARCAPPVCLQAFDINGDCVVTAAILNSFVHVLMYSHYLVASVGGSTPWKKYLTMCQLVQFAICFCHPLIAYTIGPDCGYPDFLKVRRPNTTGVAVDRPFGG